MIFEDKYYHGLGNNTKSILEEIKKLELVLKTGLILSKAAQLQVKYNDYGFDRHYNKYGFNGYNYVSLCDGIYGKDEEISAYNLFIKNSISLIIDNSVPNIIYPNILPKKASFYTVEQLKSFSNDNNKVRHTDLIDEVQVKDYVELKYLVGIGFPIEYLLSKARNPIYIAEFYLYMKELLKNYNHNCKIYDIDKKIDITEETVLKKIIKYSK